MEGLDYVKDGDNDSIGLGYWLLDVVHFSKEQEKTPLYNKLYSSDCGAKSENLEIKDKTYDLWLVVTKRENGGYCWLLTRSPKEDLSEIIEEAFISYGFRWKIEEYHRHIKKCYNLEDIQIKIFDGLQSMLAILTIAMSIIYSSLSSLHTRLILESGIKTMNKEKLYELYNFVYYKISTILKVLLANVKPRAFLPQVEPPENDGQLSLCLNFQC